MKKTLLILTVIFLNISLFSQIQSSYSLDEEINKILTKEEKQEISQAQTLLQNGDELKKQADQQEQQAQDIINNIDLLKRSKQKKARKKYEELHTQAMNTYVKAYTKYILGKKKIYKTYLNNLSKIKQELTGTTQSQFQSYTNKAQELYDQAQSLIREGYASKQTEEKYKKYQKADVKLTQAIDYQKKAYKTYFDKKYKHQKKIVKTQSQTTPTSRQPETNKPLQNISNTQKTTSIPKTQPTNTYTPPTKPQTTKEPQKTYTTYKTNSQQPKTHTQTKQEVYFRVQVAASKVKLSQAKLHSIYPGKIYMEYDPYDGKYKYLTAEKFSTYQSAKNFKINCGVLGAFVVAYKNGQRVRNICTVVPCQK